jgi:hypothetical protein
MWVLHLFTYFFIDIVGQERHEPFIEGSVFEGWQPVQDLPLCLDVLKHRASLDRGGIFLPKIKYKRWKSVAISAEFRTNEALC